MAARKMKNVKSVVSFRTKGEQIKHPAKRASATRFSGAIYGSKRSTKLSSHGASARRVAKDQGINAKLLSITDSEIPFMISCANKGIRSFVIVSGPSKREINKTDKPLNVGMKLIIPLKDVVSNSPAMVGKLVNNAIKINGFTPGEAMIVTRNIEGLHNKS